METTPVTPEKTLPRFRPIWVSLLVCLIGLFATYFWLQHDNPRMADEHALLSSGALAESASLLLTPLVVNEDRISINYLLNEMANQPVIRGMRLTDAQGTILGLSGSQQGQTLSFDLTRNEEALGKLEVWADSSSLLAMLEHQQQMMTIGAGVTLFVLLMTLWIVSRPPAAKDALKQEEDPDSFDEILAQYAEPEQDDDSLPTLDPDDLESLNLPPMTPFLDEPKTQTPNAPFTPPQKQVKPVSAPVDVPPMSIPVEKAQAPKTPVPPAQSSFTPASEPARATIEPSIKPPTESVKTDFQHWIPERDMPAKQDHLSISLTADDDDEELDNDELVSLLRPERDTPQIPRFTPVTAGQSRDLDKFDKEPWIEIEERKPEPSLSLVKPNPLLTALDDDEPDFNILPFEQDLELTISPEEAGYLLLIDTTSAHSELVEEDEHKTLLNTYFKLANSVSAIYNGRVERAKNGDLQIIFDQPQADDTHGVNAMCAAMLFTHLYKQYNHSRIRLFRPVMNLHMALVRGKADKVDRLLEEARFLTRTTQSNELISHTALTESPHLKESLLDGASIRREAEDKVLILQISHSYQELLEKQSRHLIAKLNQ